MAVKLSRYVFRMIKGRVIAIRKDVMKRKVSKSANRAINKAQKYEKYAKKAKNAWPKMTGKGKRKFKKLLAMSGAKSKLKKEAKFIGSGVDFNVYGGFKMQRSNYVLKLPKYNVSREIKGPILKRHPHLNDKVARSKALADELPNWNIPTIHTQTVRINKKQTALIQEKVTPVADLKTNGMPPVPGTFRWPWDYAQREAAHLKKETGLVVDAHVGNITKNGYLFDTGLGYPLPNSANVKKYGHSILDEVGSHAGVTELVSESAMSAGVSKKAMKKLNAMIKKGYKLKKKSRGSKEYKLVKPKRKMTDAETYAKAYKESKAEELSYAKVKALAKKKIKK